MKDIIVLFYENKKMYYTKKENFYSKIQNRYQFIELIGFKNLEDAKQTLENKYKMFVEIPR